MCKSREASCNKCGLKGHFEKVCRKEKAKRVNQIADEGDSAKASCDCGVCSSNLNCVHSENTHHSGVERSLFVRRKKITFEIDSGAVVTVMSLRDFLFYFKEKSLIRESDLTLSVASGQKLKVVGQAEMQVTKNINTPVKILPIVVVRECIPKPLLGRNWLDILDLSWRKSLLPVNMVQENNSLFDEMQNNFGNVFQSDVKTYIKNFKASIILKENAVPIFKKAYGIPYRILGDVDKKIDELVENGHPQITVSGHLR